MNRLSCKFSCIFPVCLGFISITLSAQNSVWNERIDSSVIQVRRARPELTVIPIQPSDLLRTASPLGEADPVKFIQTLPGVSTGMEGSSAYYVRGGNQGNNLTTLDGIPLYGTGHLLGLTTAYPSEMISKNDFFVGGYPSESGGFTSSLLQLTTKDGGFQESKGSAFINNFLAGAHLSRPLKKDKVSLLASVRVSPLSLEYNLLRPLMDEGSPIPDRIQAQVGDVFAKITWKRSDRERIFFSIFGSYDRYAFDPNNTSFHALGWSNLMAILTWNRGTSTGWEWDASLSHNDFRSFQDQTHRINSNTTRLSLQSVLTEEGIQAKASRQWSDRMHFQAGADIFLSFFKPGVSKVYHNKELNARAGNSLATIRNSFHSQLTYNHSAFQATLGLRGTAFISGGYQAAKPSADLLLSYRLTPSFTLKATYDHTVQFFHSLEGIPTGWSMEMLVPSTRQNRPETADQVWAGFEFSQGVFSFSASGFYKNMKDLVFFADASSFFNAGWKEWQSNLESGKGHSYGLEVLSRMDSPRFSGQLSYTLSKTDRIFSSLNFGHPIPFKFDRRHILNITGELKLAKNNSLTAGLSYMSGHWETVPSGSYPIYSLGPEEKQEVHFADYTSHPNNFQLPAYFRMDVGYHVTLQGKKSMHDLSFGIYNLTNRHNAYSLSWDGKEGRWKKLSIFPILPNFTYRISFN